MCDVLVMDVRDGKTRQNRVAMVAVVVDGILAVRRRWPHVGGEEVVLRFVGPAIDCLGVFLVQPLHFLQEHDVRPKRTQAAPQLMHHHVAIELRKPLVDVVGDDVNARRGHDLRGVEHLFDRQSGQTRLVFRDVNPIDDVAFGEVFEHPGQMLRVDPLHG